MACQLRHDDALQEAMTKRNSLIARLAGAERLKDRLPQGPEPMPAQ
jgi:hypothetical protein